MKTNITAKKSQQQRNLSAKEVKQQKKLQRMITSLAGMVEDTTKKWYKSRTFWTTFGFITLSAAIMIVDGYNNGSALGGVYAFMVLVLRSVTNKGIRF